MIEVALENCMQIVGSKKLPKLKGEQVQNQLRIQINKLTYGTKSNHQSYSYKNR